MPPGDPKSVVTPVRRGDETFVTTREVLVYPPKYDKDGNVIGEDFDQPGHPEKVTEAVTKNEEDIFVVVASNLEIFVDSVLNQEAWGPWQRIKDSGYEDGFTAPIQPIAAVKRDEHQLDIFVTGRDGVVFTNYVVDHGDWNNWIWIDDAAHPDQRWRAAPGSPVTAVKRDEHQLDIFVVGHGGAIFTNWVVDDGPWNEWIRIEDSGYEDGFTAPIQPIAAVKRDEHQLDIFVTGRDGVVFTNYVVDHGDWNNWIWIDDAAHPDQRWRAAPGSPVTAVKRDEHQLDIFVVGPDGQIYTNWVTDHGHWNNWIRIGRDFTAPIQPIAAVKRDEHQLDIFLTAHGNGIDGVYTNWVVDHGSWQDEWLRIDDYQSPDHFIVPSGSPVTAVKRDDHQLDIFVVDGHGHIRTNWVMDHDHWNYWVQLS